MREGRIKNLIKTWRERSHNEGDQFASFVFIWFCFNAWLEFLSNKKTDRQMLDELKRKDATMISLIEAYESAFSSDMFFKQGLRSLVAKSKEGAIQDARGQKPPIKISSDMDFTNVVEAIYRIRCNLFHGGKDANDARDQVLVRDAGMVLRQWMGELIRTWN